MRSRFAIAVFLVAVLTGAERAAAREADVQHIRPLDSFAARLIASSLARSETIRELDRQLRSSSVVVYVHCTWRQTGGADASLRWLSEAGGLRYTVVGVALDLAMNRRVERLGHELHHAVEIVGAPWVHSEDDMRVLFQDIGYRALAVGGMDTFETAAARDTERQVRKELWGGRLEPGRYPR